MGVKVKLADAREIGDRKYRAGDVVEVHPGDARLLSTLGVARKVDDKEKTATGALVPEAVPGNEDVPKDEPAAGDSAAGDDKSKSGAARRKG